MGGQRRLIAAASASLASDSRVIALWVGGSLASGEADEWSDVDLHAVIEDDDAEELRATWRQLVHAFTPTVMATSFPGGMIGGFCVTPDWSHVDLVLHPKSAVTAATLELCMPLFDKTGGILPKNATRRPETRRHPYYPSGVPELFFYYLGNLVVCVGRNENVLAMGGAIVTREQCLLPLLFAESGVVRTGGAKRLKPFLTDEQHRVLEALPSLEATWESVVRFHVAMSREFIARGRALAAATGGVWPFELEEATRAHLQRHLGIDLLE